MMNIQEIAKLAGVSPATVSRVFSHHPGISEDVRNKVFDIARSHNYHPRFSQKQKNVVIITPYNSEFPAQSCVDMILMALMQKLPQQGFRLEILPLNNIERLESIQFCGAVAIGGELSDFPGWAERFPVPLVIVDRPPWNRRVENVCFVRSDEEQGMELAIKHLVQHGCRKIGCIIHGTPERGNAKLRHDAVTAALKQHGLPVDPLLICYSGDGSEKYVELIGKLLKRGVDALFCPGGNAGISGVYALSLFNRKIPEDISLIASEQTFYSRFAVPPQTTISPDYSGMAEAVGKVLTDWLDNAPLTPVITLPYRLIERESVSEK
ncbi:MAG: LacI family DNA-binding transcriptional regulator [Lentisphaeria bacterium]|nr:LacI family DNA-binding transcriptional regulator [Lentisphaeria bacterium]